MANFNNGNFLFLITNDTNLFDEIYKVGSIISPIEMKEYLEKSLIYITSEFEKNYSSSKLKPDFLNRQLIKIYTDRSTFSKFASKLGARESKSVLKIQQDWMQGNYLENDYSFSNPESLVRFACELAVENWSKQEDYVQFAKNESNTHAFYEGLLRTLSPQLFNQEKLKFLTKFIAKLKKTASSGVHDTSFKSIWSEMAVFAHEGSDNVLYEVFFQHLLSEAYSLYKNESFVTKFALWYGTPDADDEDLWRNEALSYEFGLDFNEKWFSYVNSQDAVYEIVRLAMSQAYDEMNDEVKKYLNI